MVKRRFRPTLWGTIAVTAGVAATTALGVWQLDRAEQKEAWAARQAELARAPALRIENGRSLAQGIELRQVEAYGRFEPAGVVWLDNRVRRGVVGYEVVMPLRILGSEARVLVNRGWIAGTGDRQRLPVVKTSEGDLTVSGRAVIPGKRIYELGGDAAQGRVWQNLTIERYRARVGLDVLPFMIEQSNDTGDDLLREWPTPDRGADVNRSYAIQWFALAVLIAVIYGVLGFRRDAANT